MLIGFKYFAQINLKIPSALIFHHANLDILDTTMVDMQFNELFFLALQIATHRIM